MKRLLLVHPKSRSAAAGFGNTAAWGMPPLALACVAALTPPTWAVTILDEYVEPIDLGRPADLVGITAYSVNATRAYELAGQCRVRGIPVVMGGIHASMLPEEAGRHADAVVVGEAESIWPTVVSDFEKGELKKVYQGERRPLVNLPVPRRDLMSDRYEMDVVQTTRGCPFACEFCSVTRFNGGTYRQRPVAEVLDELQTLKKKVVYFIDDNFFGVSPQHQQRAIDLCKGMVARKIKKIWGTQTSVNIARNPEALAHAYRSGCRSLYLGIESIGTGTLREMKKSVNLSAGIDGVQEAIQCIHEHGIAVVGAFIFGSDNDDIRTFARTADFILRAGVDVPQLGILTPFPGTALFDRMAGEHRLIYDTFPDDWDRCDTDHVVFKPRQLDPVDLVRGFDYVVGKTLGRRATLAGAFRTLARTRSPIAALMAYSLNRDSAKFYDTDARFGNGRR